MPAPTITALPTPPSRSDDPETFATKADAFLGAFPLFRTEANAQASYNDGVATAVTASQTAAATSATNASNSATAAAGSATTASGHATTASTQATNAAASATAAALSYDSFDDRYLGSKAANPTLDNDGNALLTGALYWNSTSNEMRVWSGSAWLVAYNPTAGVALLAGAAFTGAISAPSLTLTTALAAAEGGTGFDTYVVGDVLFASTTTALSKLAASTAKTALVSNGAGVAPSYVALDMTYLPDAALKKSVRAATTANITLTAPQTIDGVAVIAGNRVLVKDQTTTSQNGIYVVAAGAWTRPADADTSAKMAGGFVNVDEGTANGGKLFDNDFKSTDTIGTTAMTWASFVGTNDTQTLTNKTLALGSNTISGTLAQFNTACTDADFAPIASPTFTGTPASTTAAADTNSTQIATTAFVVAQASAVAPAAPGTATIGTSLRYARADHVHPLQTTVTTATTANGLNTANSYQVSSLGVGTAASGTAGEIRATNNITAFYSSDARLKENVQPIQGALGIVSAVGGKTFDWTDAYIADHGGEDGYFVRKADFGVIAQDVRAVFPMAVREREDGTLAVDYEKLVAVAFAAIAELKAEVEALKK